MYRRGGLTGPKRWTQHKKEQIGRKGKGSRGILLLTRREPTMNKQVSQMWKHFRSSLGMCLGKAQSVEHKKACYTLSGPEGNILIFLPILG